MESPIYIGIYRHTPVQVGAYHWAIVVPHNGTSRKLNEEVDIFQVGSEGDSDWKTDHIRGTHLTSNDAFLLLVELPPLTVSSDIAAAFLSSENPEQGTTPLLRAHGDWSCASWAIRCLQRIESPNGWFSSAPPGNLRDQQAYYDYIRIWKAERCELNLRNKISDVGIVGTIVDGIRVLDGRSSGPELGQFDLRKQIMEKLLLQ
ncbi:hypothetical protein CPB85DRAFT_1306394 [Mucidula mucida]|nr:hypothetical protein CPB85DRAFT_1306394 [Mucidula mucida]